MEDIIEKVLKEYFTEFKKFHTLIIVGILIIIVISQILQGYIVSKKLKKAEIKFSRFHNDQIEAIKRLYQLLVDYHYANNNLFFNEYENNDHYNMKSRIDTWQQRYYDLHYFFNLNKILFTLTITDKIGLYFEKVRTLRKRLLTEKQNLEELEYMCDGNKNAMYEFAENEIETINEKIGRIKDDSEINSIISFFPTLKEVIETEFKKINN